MVSEKFMVNSDDGRMAAARYATENFAWQLKLDRRDTMRLSLLVEETLGMVKAMVEDFYGQLWFENEGERCEIHVQATTDMNADKKQDLLSVSSSGKNALAKGFMAKLGEVFSGAIHGVGNAMDAYGKETLHYGMDLFRQQGRLWRREQEEHVEYLHTPEGLRASMEKAGFWEIRLWEDGPQHADGRLYMTAVRL